MEKHLKLKCLRLPPKVPGRCISTFFTRFRAMGIQPQQHPLCQGASSLILGSEGPCYSQAPLQHLQLRSAQARARREWNICFDIKHLQVASWNGREKKPNFVHPQFFRFFLRPCKSHPGLFAGTAARWWTKILPIIPDVLVTMSLPHTFQSILIPWVWRLPEGNRTRDKNIHIAFRSTIHKNILCILTTYSLLCWPLQELPVPPLPPAGLCLAGSAWPALPSALK